MALIKCPHCGSQISELAMKCPKCGNKIESTRKKRFCIKCGAELNENEKKCHNCGYQVEAEPTISKTYSFSVDAVHQTKPLMKKEKACRILKTITIIFICIGIIFLGRGFYKKNSYSNPDSDSSYSYSTQYTNSYVGGDAYNYIINGTYFTGYVVLGMGSLIIATITGVSSLILSIKEDEEKNREE